MFAKKLFDTYEKYKEPAILNRRFKHKDILPLISGRKTDIFEIPERAKSFCGKEIFMLKAGTGKRKILLWSQMHGNEPTATAALFDIFNFFEKPGLSKDEANTILNSCTLYFIPMLNPDGAGKFQRRNAQNIDINRDAVRLQSPEGNFLMKCRDKINPEFGFNLHDQDIWYSAGDTKYPATLSFLAPAFDKEKNINESRKKSMQLIAETNNMLQKFIPNRTGRYSDDFMASAFGDNIQKKGTSTILIESGGFKNDFEKQFVRKLNFTAILYALYSVSKNNFVENKVSDYEKIPFNRKNKLFDFLIRNAILQKNGKEFIADIGIRSEILPEKDVFLISDIGDLSDKYGYEEIDLKKREKINEVLFGENAGFLIKKFFPKVF